MMKKELSFVLAAIIVLGVVIDDVHGLISRSSTTTSSSSSLSMSSSYSPSYSGVSPRTVGTESSSRANAYGMNNNAPLTRQGTGGMIQRVGQALQRGQQRDNQLAQVPSSVEGPNDEIWDNLRAVKIQGNSLRTWSFNSQSIQSVQVHMRTEGRPLNANVDLWSGPDNTPQRVGVYLEDGNVRPFRAVIATPPGNQNAVAIRNTAEMAFPISAAVEADSMRSSNGISGGQFSLDELAHNLYTTGRPKTIQGGAVHTIPFAPAVASIQIMLKTDGRPLNARVELLQGPNNLKQVMEIYCEDGADRPFFAIVETPGVGNVVRIVNTAPMEFPIDCRIEPYMLDEMMMTDYYGGSYYGAGAGTGGNIDENNFFFLN
mmetsp:Transcript_58901/g.144063  ORF Transcript_58901/g.144063 Transcript_58901/m.144063 type:complete len:373 (-) Transcript_58901:554-1672(-)|eukprot:CAMPEP_0113522694 /NCGR_PEP_ID=MMETSP0014_2-20120614/45324_1 /TAXON_ID=2857 /ORGANISM="Nitzschia sp." /LENGTH=372 /DNA_ID=CAMNT_0000420765 /DNA_START=350 /DNA_END=1468 /DNA_ORIENTATION=+ /assembly_acc=CAM_ASM_000159